MDVKINRLESVVEQIGEAVLATTVTVERLAERIDALAAQVQHQSLQVQQQGYQIFALSDAVQTLAQVQQDSMDQLTQLTESLQRIVSVIEKPEP
ncbi:hypothetical protein [Microcoleus sp. FACHB-68]|uniref:hypothetical protein n=1 Tax=Microcoleus sp. FACHB-68 TaxID=2692826 RepID=UPI00168913B1|nr:hypothetical protein [Microcoleus sp. FACHB-68]